MRPLPGYACLVRQLNLIEMTNYQKTIRTKSYWNLHGEGAVYETLLAAIAAIGKKRLAKRLKVKPKHISEILSGDRAVEFSWKQVVIISNACGRVPLLRIISVEDFENGQKLKSMSV
jgi:hypothetical protein